MSVYRSGTRACSIRHPDERVIGPSWQADITRVYRPASSGGGCLGCQAPVKRGSAGSTGAFDRMSQEVGEGLAHEVELGIELLADPFCHGNCDVHDDEAGVHPQPEAAQDPQHVEQHLADLDLAEPVAPEAPHELDDGGPVTLERLRIAGRAGGLR